MDAMETDQNFSADSEESKGSLKLFPLDRDSSVDSLNDEPEKLIPLDGIFYKSSSEQNSSLIKSSENIKKKPFKIFSPKNTGNVIAFYDSDEVEEQDECLNVATQTTTDTISVLLSVNTEIRQHIEELEANICSTFFSVYKIKDDKSMLMFTGFTRNGFNSLSRFLCDEMYEVVIDPLEQFFVFCVYVKTGVSLKVLAKMFGFPFVEFSNMIKIIVDNVYIKLKTVNMWSTKKEIENAMPSAFKTVHPRYRIAIGCLKIPMNSKRENGNKSLKGFVAVSPFSSIAFISRLDQGNISNRNMVLYSGILEKLEPEDVVLAQENIDIGEELQAIKCTFTTFGSYNSTSEEKSFSLKMLLQTQVEQIVGKVKKYGCCKRQGSKSIDLMNKLFYISAFFVKFQEVIDTKGLSIL